MAWSHGSNARLLSGLTRLELLNHLARIGKASGLVLGKDQLAINLDVEDAPAAGNQLCLNAKGFSQLVRQTGGFGVIVSNCTIGNLDVHSVSPGKIAVSG
jgi:hypothetical protein